jgi:PAS domain S-box-containing protein
VVWANITASLVRDASGRPQHQISLVEDITERKKAEEALKESEERFRDLARFLPETIFELNRQDNLTFVNEQAFARFGYTRRDFAKGLDGLDMIAPQDRPRARQNMTQILAGQDLGLTEYNGLRKDGTIFPVLMHSTPIIKNGETVGLRGFIIDITDRKKSEEALLKSEERYRFITEKATDVIWQTDLKGNFQFLSPSFEPLTGWSAKEGLSLNLKDVMASDCYELVAKTMEKRMAAAGKVADPHIPPLILPLEALRKDGSSFIAEVSVKLLRDEAGRPIGITGITRDVTERKQTEEALKKLTQDLKKRLKELNCLYGVSNLLSEPGQSFADTLNALVNLLPPAFCHAEEACVRLTLNDQKFESQNFKETESKLSSAISLGGKPIGVLEVFGPEEKTGAAEEAFIKEEIILLDVIAKRIAEWMERRQAEREKQKVETQLRQAQKMEALGTLAGGIAHDFNNILAAIMGFGEIALQNAEMGAPNTKEIGQVLAAAGRASHLIRQILTFSRKVEAQLKPLALNRVITQAVRLLKRTIPKMVNIELVLAEDLKLITGDAIQMEQVLVNLTTNAIDAMPEGGKLIIETKNVVLDDEYCAKHIGTSPGQYVLWQVSDSGAGMDEQTLRHIFDPFFTTKEVGRGTGLGLSTVYGIVKNHGGSITCHSHPGLGTEFKIYLPVLVEPARADSISELEASPELSKGTETILVVDDEEALRTSTEEILKRGGYQILTAGSGEEAIKIVQAKPDVIDLVLLDVGMPGMGGIKCFPELKKINPQIKLLMASGYAVEGPLRQVLAVSPAGFISKPYRLSELLKKVREILDAGD